MFIIEFIILLFEIIPLFLTLIIFFPINKYKILKTKEDQLFLQKSIITTIFFALDIIVGVLKVVKVITNENVLNKIVMFIFNVYIILIIFYNFFLCLELHFTFSNPVHLFNRLFKQQKFNYVPEIIISILSIITLVVDLIFYFKFDEDYKTQDIANNDEARLVMPNFYKSGVIVFFSLISILICIIKKSQIKKFAFKKQEKLLSLLTKRTISNILYFVYGALYGVPFLIDISYFEIFNIICSFVVLAIIIIDYFIHVSVLSTTKFCEYRLKKTIIGSLCSLFSKPQKNESVDSMIPLVGDTMVNDTTSAMGASTTLQANETTVSEIISNSPFDKELISMYKNSIFIEDYFMNFFDQILNILTLSIFQIYSSKFFSTKANDVRLSTDIKIGEDVSGIGGGYNNMSVSASGDQINVTKSQVGDYTASFEIKKNSISDDYSRFKDILESGMKIENNNNHLKTIAKSFFTPRCVETIYSQRLKGRHVGASLLSHMILSGSKNRSVNMENPHSNFWSLTAANGKEEYFNKLKNTCFKTFDKNFNLDIFESNDDELIIKENGKGNEISQLLDQYFTYIHAKGINGTFIPSLMGVFKVKINNFKTLLVFVTRNSLVENAPKNFFTYWQLIRFLNDKPQKIASSQFNTGRGTLVKDDPIFEKLFQVENKNDNPDFNKINIKNFYDFQETIKNDIAFLHKIGCQNFNLLLMYFEYETTQKHEKQGVIKIQKGEGDKAEIIQSSLPNDMLEDMDPSSANNNMKFPGESMKSGMFSLGGAFLDGVEDDTGGTLDINVIKQNAANLMDYSEKISMIGYEGVFDSFNCLCFFTFENIFDIKKKSIPTNFYTNFQNKILENFTSFKEK